MVPAVPPSTPAWTRALTGLWLAALTGGVWSAIAGSQPQLDPRRWTERPAPAHIKVAALAGDLPARADALDLAGYAGASPRMPAVHDATVTLRARFQEDAQLLVRLGVSALRSGPQAPQGASAFASFPSGQAARRFEGAGIAFDRARGEVYGLGVQCAPNAGFTADDARIELVARGRQIGVRIDDAEVTRCHGDWPAGDLVLASGVRSVQIDDLHIAPDGAAPFADAFGGPWRAPWASWIAAAAGLLLGAARPRGRGLALAGLPFLTIPLFAAAPIAGVLESLRLLAVPPAVGPLLLGAPLGAAALLHLLARRSGRHAMLAGVLPVVGALILAAAMRWPTDSTGWLLLGALGLPWAAIAHVNARRTRSYGALSLALTTGMVLLAEVAVRHTQVGDTWVRTAGFERAQKEFQELLEIRRYRAYPVDSFPAQPPAPDPSRQRIVALGGSSTGGAYQMDNLDLFWPRKLDARVAGRGWEVVNQGVGGWNTLHVRLYVESQLERLQPDLLALYVGHNDVMSHLPVPYRQLLAQYEATRGGGAARAFGQATALFGRSRLYMGLTYALLSLRDQGGAVAVPVADARENLARIRDLAHARGAKVLFMTEGLSPDPTPLRDYRDMLRTLAAEQGDLFLDAAEALHATRDPDLFIDDCHLTERGHLFLAEQVDTALSRAGWLPATP